MHLYTAVEIQIIETDTPLVAEPLWNSRKHLREDYCRELGEAIRLVSDEGRHVGPGDTLTVAATDLPKSTFQLVGTDYERQIKPRTATEECTEFTTRFHLKFVG